ncbi:MAG: hypothetical protein JRF15_12230 [Deltaproteobacteria bacterium]|nr:hypothetical protein [Deltaproteobacteria bacterium]
MHSADWRKRGYLRVGLLLIAIATTGFAHSRFETRSRVELGQLQVPSADYVKLWSLGFDAAVADYFWLRAIGVVGAEQGAVEEQGEVLADLIDLVTTVDPWVSHPYRFAAVWLTRDRGMVERGNRLLERAISYHPLDWRNRYHLGFNHFYYLDEQLRAADLLEGAIGLEGAPDYLAPLVARLRSREGGLQVAAAFLVQMIESAEDEYKKAEYLKALDEIQIEERARFLDEARVEYWRRNGRDIEQVTDLLAGPNPVLQRLPRAQMHLDGFEWILDPETNQIVSSFYRIRYQLHESETDRQRKQEWREREAAAEAEGA